MQKSFAAGLLAWMLWPTPFVRANEGDERAQIRALIELEAPRQEVPTPLVLAVADDESGLRNLVGDLHRADPLKRAYGPFQLQARFHLREGEQLSALLDLQTNVERGIAEVKRTLTLAGGDVLRARFIYVCGRRFLQACSSKRLREIRASWTRTWQRWRPRALVVSTTTSLCYVPRNARELSHGRKKEEIQRRQVQDGRYRQRRQEGQALFQKRKVCENAQEVNRATCATVKPPA